MAREFNELHEVLKWLLEGNEIPDVHYGERPGDRYQHTDGVARSTSKIAANIPKQKLVSASIELLDPKKQLREAGYPYSHIGTELSELHGKWELVSSDMATLKDTISEQTKQLSEKVDKSQETVLEKVEHLFDRKFLGAIGRIIAAGSVMYGAAVFLQSQDLGGRAIGALAVVAGVAIWLFGHYFIGRKP